MLSVGSAFFNADEDSSEMIAGLNGKGVRMYGGVDRSINLMVNDLEGFSSPRCLIC